LSFSLTDRPLMSSPDQTPVAPSGEERQLTIIVVAAGELETRSFVISYGKVRVAVVAAVALLLGFAVMLAMLFPIMTQAARVPALVAELQQLDSERARVAQLAQELEDLEAQYERVRQMLGADAPEGSTGTPLLPPLRRDTASTAQTIPVDPISAILDLWPLTTPGHITQRLTDAGARHPGIDIAVPSNSYIRAAGAGTVRAAGVDEVYGNYVIVSHGSGLESLYGHASSILVAAGDRVGRGQVLGRTGSSGRSTAPHLHFEVRLNGRPVDPLTYVRQP
jgi:murein DD-endopeptidase MepM/ murein hydrolase activator NlpD